MAPVVSIVGFKAKNHPQQVASAGASDEVDDRGTPPELFDPLNEKYGFTLDVAAAPHNAKCPRFYTRADNGLAQSWQNEMVWCNPPYSDLDAWCLKAWNEFVQAKGIVMLVPANRCEQGWWQDNVEPFRDTPHGPLRTEFRRGRDRFIRAGQSVIGANERPPFGCALLVWTP